jgi:hypothetical protein
LLPDFSFQVLDDKQFGPTQYEGSGIEFIHRQAGETDFYFVSNQHDQSKMVEATFRVGSRLPELWNPENGRIEVASEFRASSDDRTIVTLRLDPWESVFVVFRQPIKDETGIVTVKENGAPARVTLRREKNQFFLHSREAGEFTVEFGNGDSRVINIPVVPEPIALTGPWRTSFPSGWEAPEHINLPGLISWSESSYPGVKYFSGTATYQTQIDVPSEILSMQYKNFLDLGDVQVIAEVFINGESQGVLWKEPYMTDITNSLMPGENELIIRVANLWVNRLIGDQQYPDDCRWTSNTGSTAKGLGLAKIPEWVISNSARSTKRKAFVTWQWPHLENKELLPSGLLGPVQIITEVKTEI